MSNANDTSRKLIKVRVGRGKAVHLAGSTKALQTICGSGAMGVITMKNESVLTEVIDGTVTCKRCLKISSANEVKTEKTEKTDDVKSLLKQLEASTDKNEKKSIRAKIRRLGHKVSQQKTASKKTVKKSKKPAKKAAVKSITVTDIDDETVTIKVGDVVGFKYDVEQYSKVLDIKGRQLLVEVTEGDYSHGKMWINSRKIWID